MATKSKAGGGPASKQVKQVSVKTGGPNRAKSPAAVNQMGNHLGNPNAVAKLDVGKALPSKLGNEKARDVGVGGPGKGRTLYGQSGTNKQYGNGGPSRPAGGHFFDGFNGKE